MRTRRTTIVPALLIWILACFCNAAAQAGSKDRTAWFDREKIRFFWGPWVRFTKNLAPETIHGDIDPISYDELMGNVAQVGATVFASNEDWARVALGRGSVITLTRQRLTPDDMVERARLARKHGLRYFGFRQVYLAMDVAKAFSLREAVNMHGLTSKEEQARGMKLTCGDRQGYVPCPLEEGLAREWLLKPAMEMAQTGVVDGCHIDMESYGTTAYNKLGDYLCYCDDCFGKFMEKEGLDDAVARAERYAWLKEKGRHREYLAGLRDRMRDLYRGVAEQVRRVKSDFVFSAYEYFVPGELESFWKFEGLALGLSSAEAPLFILDAGHYWPNHSAPWWDTGHAMYRKLGMRHILGTWTGGIFGGHPAIDVGATQWMYDAAMSHDGYWVWFEHKWGPDAYRAFRTVDRRIRTVEGKVGEFLRNGEPDHTFVCVVEQSGDPVLGRNVIPISYHLGKRHLVRVANVNTDMPVEVLVRFPRLPEHAQWTVTDPIGGLHYTHGHANAVWRNRDLKAGVLVPLEKRSDQWLLLSRAPRRLRVAGDRTIPGQVIRSHPERPKAEGPLPAGAAVSGDFPLLYVKSGPRGYARGGGPKIVLGTSVHFIDAAGKGTTEKHLFGIKGDCWSPALSPDGTRVAVSGTVNGKGQIYLVNADSRTSVRRPGVSEKPVYRRDYWAHASGISYTFAFVSDAWNISDNEYSDASPTWSPDGNRIAFASDRDGDWEIYVMNADGSNQRRLTRSPGVDRAPAWSPAGETIAFESDRNGSFDIYRIEADGTGQRALVQRTRHIYEPVWSPDGSRIVCSAGVHGFRRDVLVADADDGASVHPLGLSYAAKDWWQYTNVYSLCWSPDGERIAGAFEKGEKSGVFTVRADGTDLRDLVVADALKPYPGGEVNGHRQVGGWYYTGSASRRWLLKTFKDVQWSPDGKRIAFYTDIDPSGYFFIHTVSSDGGELTRLDDTLSPAGPKNKLPPP